MTFRGSESFRDLGQFGFDARSVDSHPLSPQAAFNKTGTALPQEGAQLYRTSTLGQREQMRSTAYLDSKKRTIGADDGAWNAQVAEKTLEAAIEADEKAQQHRALESAIVAAVGVERAVVENRRMDNDWHRQVWDIQKDKTLRKEWDLSDPAQVRNAKQLRDLRPLYEEPEAIRGHASSLQVFEAELLDNPAIPAANRKRLIQGLDKGVSEIQEKRVQRAEELAATAKHIGTATRAASAVEQAAALHAAEQRMITKEHNENLAITRSSLAATKAAELKRLAEAHVAKEEANPMLREDTRRGLATGSKVRVDHFKGLSKEQQSAIYAQLDLVKADRESTIEKERLEKEKEDDAALKRAKAAEQVELFVARERKDKIVDYYQGLKEAAEEKRRQRELERQEERTRQFPTSSGILAGFGRTLK
jgi:RIB43A